MSRNAVAEQRVLRLAIIGYWLVFWFLNVVDKIIISPTFLWAGKDRLAQFTNYFTSIGITGETVPLAVLAIVTALEVVALIFFVMAIIHYLRNDHASEHTAVFYGIITSLGIFTLFAVGDQIFGDRFELLEHSIYWVGLIITWFLYTSFCNGVKK